MNKLKIGNFPTPVYKIDSLSDYYGTNIYIKRDDFSGLEVSGNKIRKLEYLVYDAIDKECDVLITSGGVQSNHARATAVVSAMYGLDCYLVLEGEEKEFEGNLFLDEAFGAKIIFTNNVKDSIEELEAKLYDIGKKPYIIPMGGSNYIGSKGYFDQYKEILAYENESNIKFDTITFAIGSAGTYAGIYHANEKLSAGKKQIHGISVNNSEEFFIKKVREILKDSKDEIDTSKIYINDKFIGPGYAKYRKEDIEFYLDIARKTGILFDPCYTGKAFEGFISNIENKFDKNGNHLFIHTGGIFGWTKEMREMAKEIIREK